MHTFWTFFSIGVFFSLIGYIWLTVVGFKRNVLWGVLVLLFSPISALVFAALNWREARYAFLVYAVSMVMIFGSMYSFYSRYSPLFMQAAVKIKNGELTDEQAKSLVTYGLLHDKTSLQAVIDEVAPQPTQEDSEHEPSTNNDGGRAAAVGGQENAKQQENTKQTEAATAPADATIKPTPLPSLSQAQPDPLAVKKPQLPSKTVVVSMSRVSNYIGHYLIITLKNGNERRGLLVKVESSYLTLDRKLYGGNVKYRIRKNEIKRMHMLRNPPKER